MAIYTVTTSNWSDPSFWSSINETSGGHTIDFSGLPSSFSVDFDVDSGLVTISSGMSTFTIGDSTYGGSSSASLGGSTTWKDFSEVSGSQGDDQFHGSNNADSYEGEAGDDTISGGSGDDYLDGWTGDDSIEGGDGNDTILGYDGRDTISGGAGNDTIAGEGGSDSLDGGSGDDVIDGGSGQDTIRGGTGNDTMDGGSSADTFIVDDGFGNDVIIGGEGGFDYDTIDLSALSGPVTVSYTGTEAGTITDGTNTITFSQIEHLILTEFNDSVDASNDHQGLSGDHVGVDIEGRGGDDTITGGRGGDTIDGGTGNDQIDGGYGDDSLLGGDGNDTVVGGSGNDTIEGGDGADSIDGGLEADTLVGGSGADTIEGGDGNDFIDGGADNDSLLGGEGNDSIVGGDGLDSLYGGAGADTLDGGSGTDLLVGGTGNDVLDGGTFNDTLLGGEGDDTLLAGYGADSFDGGDGTDSYVIGGTDVENYGFNINLETGSDQYGNSYSNIENIVGGNASDTLTGDDADNVFEGGGGNDVLDGGGGDDTLEGGVGNDVLTGGAGDDTFVYNAGDGLDTIMDFNTGNTGALGDADPTNNDFIDLSNFYDDINEVRNDWADDGILNQSNTSGEGAADYSNNTQMADGDGIAFEGASRESFTTDNTGVVCFTKGTAILTPKGDVLIEDLRIGDLVCTLDNGPQPLMWIGTRKVTGMEMATDTTLRPVRIQRGVLGNRRKMLVSRQHGMVLGQNHLARAIHLSKCTRGVGVLRHAPALTYMHLMFEAHQIVFAEGIASESFYPGPQALTMMGEAAKAELRPLLPLLNTAAPNLLNAQAAYGARARTFLPMRDVAEWTRRDLPELSLVG